MVSIRRCEIRLNLKTAVETGSTRKCPANQRVAGMPFHPLDERRVAQIPDRHSREGGHPWKQKTRSPRVLSVGPRLRGTTLRLDSACVFTRKSPSTAVSRLIAARRHCERSEAIQDRNARTEYGSPWRLCRLAMTAAEAFKLIQYDPQDTRSRRWGKLLSHSSAGKHVHLA